MFNRQAEELAKEMGREDVLLKELYDALEEEDNIKRKEYEFLKKQQEQINLLLDLYGIPRNNNGKLLSTLERLYQALARRLYA